VTDGPQVPTPLAEADRWARRRRVLIPALIALTSLLGSVGAWRAAAASGAASSAERKAFADAVAAEQQRAAIETVVGSIEITYARRAALQEAAAALRQRAEGAAQDEVAQLAVLADAYEAAAAQAVIDADALAADGSLDLEAKRQVEWARAASTQDLDPEPEMAEAENLRAKSERLVGLTALFIAAALFLTLAQVSRRPRVAALFWHGGLVVLVVSAVLLLVVEVR
jgi:hypothetical protein